MPKHFTDEEKNRIRSRIKETAVKLFLRFGLKRTRIEDITQQIGIAKGTFYSFFPSKEELFMDLIEETEVVIKQNLYKKIIALAKPGPKILVELIKNEMIQILKMDVIQMVFEQENWHYYVNRIPAERMDHNFAVDIQFIEEIMDYLGVKDNFSQEERDVLSGAFRGVFMLLLHKKEVGKEVFDEVMDIFLSTLFEKMIPKESLRDV